jgi:2'-5' RNA ligase
LICYLEIESQKKLKEYFKKFDRKFKIKEISENNLKFVPHITLFRIKNASIYEEHKVKIENIILEELERIKEKNISI